VVVLGITLCAMAVQVTRDLGQEKWLVAGVGGVIALLTVWVTLEGGLAWRRQGAPQDR
jgi:hypothetical protein